MSAVKADTVGAMPALETTRWRTVDILVVAAIAVAFSVGQRPVSDFHVARSCQPEPIQRDRWQRAVDARCAAFPGERTQPESDGVEIVRAGVEADERAPVRVLEGVPRLVGCAFATVPSKTRRSIEIASRR